MLLYISYPLDRYQLKSSSESSATTRREHRTIQLSIPRDFTLILCSFAPLLRDAVYSYFYHFNASYLTDRALSDSETSSEALLYPFVVLESRASSALDSSSADAKENHDLGTVARKTGLLFVCHSQKVMSHTQKITQK
jgi:hypothetical protein